MYGSRIIRDRARTALKANATVFALVGSRMYFGSIPNEIKFPFLWARRSEPGIDDGPMVKRPVNSETLSFDFSIVINGRTTDEIYAAAVAMDEVIAMLNAREGGYFVTAISVGEIPDIDPIFGIEFEQLGRTWQFTVTSQED